MKLRTKLRIKLNAIKNRMQKFTRKIAGKIRISRESMRFGLFLIGWNIPIYFLWWSVLPALLGDYKGLFVTAFLSVYFYALWQFDHSVAPLVWEHQDEIHLDGWWFEKWLGKEFFEITNVYNVCVVFLILMPILLALIGALPCA
jgi:hypothetical protein